MQIYGIIGYPIKHSLSPAMQNAAFKKLGIDAKYIPFEVNPRDLKKFLKGVFRIGIKGLNVTIPHKESCMALLDKIDGLASKIGAVNTICIKNSKLIGFNTDAHGFIKALKDDLGFDAKNKSIFLLGSGGAARAVGFSLAGEGAGEIKITDLELNRSEKLAKNIKKFYPSCKAKILKPKKLYVKEDLRRIDLLVNATPVGLHKDDPVLFAQDVFTKNLFVYDLVYHPEKTRLIETAQKKGLRAHGGLSMLLYQGSRSFELWTGKKAPIEAMRNALRGAI